jgi:hypothetical protein
MKKVTLIAIAFLALQLNAQEKVSTYNVDYLNKNFDIMISKGKKDNYTLYLQILSIDNISKNCGIYFNKKNHEELLKTLIEAKQKYIEWSEIAEKNNVNDLLKPMDIKSLCNGAYFDYGSGMHAKSFFNSIYQFKVSSNDAGKVSKLMLIKTGELQSSSNQFIKSDGGLLIFSSVSEIDFLLNEISIDKIKEYTNKPDHNELFK